MDSSYIGSRSPKAKNRFATRPLKDFLKIVVASCRFYAILRVYPKGTQKKAGSLSMKRKELRASHKAIRNGENQMIITRQIAKTVKDAQGKDFKRKANIQFAVPENPSDITSALEVFGSIEQLVTAAIYGVFARAKYDANNELMKSDKASKALKNGVKALKVVMPNKSDEELTTMFLAISPEVASAFTTTEVPAEINYPVTPAKQTLFRPTKNADGSEVVGLSAFLASGEDEDDDEKEPAA